MTQQFAAIDLGSNSFRLEIGHFEGGRFVSDRYSKETVRLAAGFDASGNFTPRIQEKALISLSNFSLALRGFAAHQVRAVGTQALREAKNARLFLEKAERALGFPIRIISGAEEAGLVFKGCVSSLPKVPERRLVIDIGGASTELALGEGTRPEATTSFPIGSVNMTARFFGDGTITEERLSQAVAYAKSVFEPAAATYGRALWENAYGSAGTIGAILLVARTENWGPVISEEVLARALRAFAEAGSIGSLNLRGLKADRRDIIAGGLATLCALFKTFGVRELKTTSGSLRSGLFHEMLEEAEHA